MKMSEICFWFAFLLCAMAARFFHKYPLILRTQYAEYKYRNQYMKLGTRRGMYLQHFGNCRVVHPQQRYKSAEAFCWAEQQISAWWESLLAGGHRPPQPGDFSNQCVPWLQSLTGLLEPRRRRIITPFFLFLLHQQSNENRHCHPISSPVTLGELLDLITICRTWRLKKQNTRQERWSYMHN